MKPATFASRQTPFRQLPDRRRFVRSLTDADSNRASSLVPRPVAGCVLCASCVPEILLGDDTWASFQRVTEDPAALYTGVLG